MCEVRRVKKTETKSFRKKRKFSKSDYIRIAVCSLIICGFLYTIISQQVRLANIRKETAQCQEELALKKKEYERFSEKAEHNGSDEFYEEKAREEGYVYENETVFVVVN